MISYSLAFNEISLSIEGQLCKSIDTTYPDFKGIFDMVWDDIRQQGINGITRRHVQCNSYQLSNQKDSRASVFSMFRKNQVFVIK